MKSRLFAAAAAVASLVWAQEAGSEPASNYQIDAAHDGQIRFIKDFHAPLKQRWVKNLGGTPSYPVYGDGMVFISSFTNTGTEIYALTRKHGDVVWHTTVQGGGAPMYDDGRVFILGNGGFLQAFDAKTGAQLWGKQEGGQFFFDDPGTASNGQIYFIGNESGVTLYAVRETDGSLHYTTGGPAGDSVPAVGGKSVYVTYPCDDSAYKAKTGTFQWAFTQGCDGGGGGTPVYFQNRLYVDDTVSKVVLDATTGEELRPFVDERFVPAFWQPLSGNAMGFVVNSSNTLIAFDAASGATAWSATKSFSVPPVVVNDTMFIGDASGNLYAYDPATGNSIWSTNLGAEIGDGGQMANGLGAGGDMLLVPYGTKISAWIPK